MKYLFKQLLIFSYAIVALACSHSNAPTGKATLSGKFTDSVPSEQTSIFVKFPIPVFYQIAEYATTLNTDGSFSISVPVFCPTYVQFLVGDKPYTGALLLSPDKETKIELSFDEAGEIQIKMMEGSELTSEDMAKMIAAYSNSYESFFEIFADVNIENNLRSDTLPEEYKASILKLRETWLSNTEGIDSVPKKLRPLLYSMLPSWGSFLFDYEGRKPDRSYFSFLRLFDLNTPPYNLQRPYPNILKAILDDKVLDIPHLGDQPVEDWLKEAKTIMADLIGSDTGLFYDMLTFQVFFNQIVEDVTPLSDQQKENIQTYFKKNPTYTEYLFIENEKLLKMQSAPIPTTINETPQVAKEKLMDTIISKYKGKVVLVDFWATWCGPCLIAMSELEPMKHEMNDKDIVFVYITNPSSPFDKFEKQTKKVNGEHYYLTEEEWNYISKNIDSDAVPTYLIYDTYGVLKNKSIGFPGTEAIRKMIEELAP
jgi:thiol-disulfide isomerase/thioredoxin